MSGNATENNEQNREHEATAYPFLRNSLRAARAGWSLTLEEAAVAGSTA
ncbi:hypothetical protein [Pedococcus sp. 5OH_020]|nr:hypothetical protein [Pedococcus sp. 5OH_020]